MSKSPERKLTGRGVLLWLVAFFGIVIGINVVFIIVSASTFRGEDEQKPYLQGVEYNQILKRRAAQAAAGWQASLSAIRLDSGDVRILLSLRGRDGAPVKGESLAGELRHPADENRDHALKLAEVGPGRYQVDVHEVASGDWDVVLAARGGKAPFEAMSRLWVP